MPICAIIQPQPIEGMTIIHPKWRRLKKLTLTEELFRATQLNKYKETIDPIMPGSGLLEKMFEGSQHAANYVLDTRLTFKVNKWKKGKTTKTKKY